MDGGMWLAVLDFAYVALFFILATILKSRIAFFRKFIIPTSIIAGFIGLIVGPNLLGWISFDIDRLGNMVYHLMAIGFIALSLKERERKKNKDIVSSGIMIASVYLIQGIVGFVLSLLLVYTVYPDLFPPVGLLLPLGFGQGPGQAYSIGIQWEELGLSGGGNLGLTVATFGFLWATIIGVPILNYLVRKGKASVDTEQAIGEQMMVREEMSPDEQPLSDAHDKLSFQIALIAVVYLLTYLSIHTVTKELEALGTFGQTFAQLLWGFHFLIGSLYAIGFRVLFEKLKKKGFAFYNVPNNYLLQRIAGSSFDFMITASIAAISFYALKNYLVPVLLITTIGGIVTVFHIYYLSKWIYKKNPIENFLGFYGMGTGTISTGMALVRAVDPKFQTNVSENLVMGSAVAVVFGMPLMVMLNIPIFGYVENQPIMYLYTLLIFLAYLGLLFLFLFFHVRKQDDAKQENRKVISHSSTEKM